MSEIYPNFLAQHSSRPRPHLTLNPRRLKSLRNAAGMADLFSLFILPAVVNGKCIKLLFFFIFAANVKFHVWYDSNPLASNSVPQRLQVKVRPRVQFVKVMKTAAAQNSAFS